MTHSQQELKRLKQVIASKLVFATLVVCVIAFPITLLSWQSSGFEPIYAVHVLLISAALFLSAKPQPEKQIMNYGFVVSFLSLISAYGVYQFGWSAGSLSVLISAVCIIAVGFTLKTTVIFASFTSVCVIAFNLIQLSSFAHPIDISSMPNLILNSWVYSLVCIAVSLGFISIILLEYRRKLGVLLTALTVKNEQIDYLANHDHLTGLSSPRLAQEQLELTLNMAKRHEFKAAILYINVDKFRLINDALGHDAGDFALKEVAKTLKELIRDTDIACRQGGDEFLLILHYPVSRTACDLICKRLISAFDARFPYNDHEIKINLNIGVAIFPDHGSNQFELRSKADKALQKSKSDQKHHYTFAK